MKTLFGTSEPVEKERIRLQINAQVEEFLRRGGAIEVVTDNSRSAMAIAGSGGDDQGEMKSFPD